MPWILASSALLLFGGGKAAEGVGEGVDKASNGVLKIGAALAVGYIVLKKMEVV